jgi:hypothetical protein
MTFEFNQPYTYQYLNLLKKCESKFNPELKTWNIPLKFRKTFFEQKKQLDDENKERVKSIWKESCDECNYKFVKKGTDEYNEVMSVFKEKLKN